VIVTISGPVRKRCPYKDERDEGTATFTFNLGGGEAPELHDFAKHLDAASEDRISHEDYTRALYVTWHHAGLCHVRTTWITAGLEVTVDVPDRRQ
jgi:hypothetical protein